MQKLILQLREIGYELREIAEMFGLSHQAISYRLGPVGRLIVYPLGFRRCYGCKKTLPESNFYSPKTNRCIPCDKSHTKKYAKPEDYSATGKYAKQAKCRYLTSKMIKSGIILKEDCLLKSDDCRGRIEAHHHAGYNHPELVKFYCAKHHRVVDPPKWGNPIDKT